MQIDSFIDSRLKKDTRVKRGGNKKVYIFNDYVLLAGGFKEDEIKQIISITNNLKNNNVAVVPTLEYKIIYPPDEIGYAHGYILQPRAKGTELYSSNMSKEEYKKMLHDIANLDIKKMDKFVSDWLIIEKSGLMIDPSKTTNFFFSEDGIGFIDLNLKKNKEEPLKTYFMYACGVLTDYLRNLFLEKADEYIIQIIKKVALCFVCKGLKIKDVSDVLSSGLFLNALNKTQIYSVITFLTEEQKTHVSPVKQFENERYV